MRFDGEVPLHPDESGNDANRHGETQTGLLGVISLLGYLAIMTCAMLVCIPFVLLGTAEFVWSGGPGFIWRVRWRRES